MKSMNQIIGFIDKLAKLGVELWCEEERLHYRCRHQELTPKEKDKLIKFEPQLLSLLPYYGFYIPLSFGQQALWQWHSTFPQSTIYNVSLSLNIKGSLDVEAVKSSCQQLLDRHQLLRTTFAVIDHQPRQLVSNKIPLSFELTLFAIWG